MPGVNRIEVRPGGHSHIGYVTSRADTCMRQLLALNDIGTTPSINTVISDFFDKYKPLLSHEDLSRIAADCRKIANAVEGTKDYLEGTVERFEPVVASDLDGEPGAFIVRLSEDLAFRGTSDHETLMNRALVAAAISSVEILFGDLARAIYQRNFTALSKSSHEFTLEELNEYNSIEEAREALITRRVEALIRPGVFSWAEWLQRTTNVDLKKTVPDWPTIREIFARRNAIVHADCKVDPRYLQEVHQSGLPDKSLSIGMGLPVTSQYLRDSLERLMALSLVMTREVLANLYRKERDESAQWLGHRQDYLARRELWRATSIIATYVASTSCRRTLELQAQINGWIARGHMEGPESVAGEISAWDVEGLSEHYQTAKALLQDDMERAEPLITRALEEGRLTRVEIISNPMYSSYRRTLGPEAGS